MLARRVDPWLLHLVAAVLWVLSWRDGMALSRPETVQEDRCSLKIVDQLILHLKKC